MTSTMNETTTTTFAAGDRVRLARRYETDIPGRHTMGWDNIAEVGAVGVISDSDSRSIGDRRMVAVRWDHGTEGRIWAGCLEPETPLTDVVTCDGCDATSDSGWGDEPYCTDCLERRQRTFAAGDRVRMALPYRLGEGHESTPGLDGIAPVGSVGRITQAADGVRASHQGAAMVGVQWDHRRPGDTRLVWAGCLEPESTEQAPRPFSVGDEVVVTSTPRRYRETISVYGNPQVGAQGTITNPVDRDGEVEVQLQGYPTRAFMMPDCLRHADTTEATAEPTDEATVDQAAEVARLRRELAVLRQEQAERMEEFGIKAQLMANEAGMCPVFEDFMRTNGLPTPDIPWEAEITVTYRVTGKALHRNYASEGTLREALIHDPEEAVGVIGHYSDQVEVEEIEHTSFVIVDVTVNP